jgi:hypothetical protein
MLRSLGEWTNNHEVNIEVMWQHHTPANCLGNIIGG